MPAADLAANESVQPGEAQGHRWRRFRHMALVVPLACIEDAEVGRYGRFSRSDGQMTLPR